VDSPEPDETQRASAGGELGLLDGIAAELADVQAALDRLDQGTYGNCESCGEPIDGATLESSPTARFCADHLPFKSWP
jgi:RNA polymerase-binding transcription factor DksA